MTSISTTIVTRSDYKAINRALYSVAGITLKGDRDEITVARIIAHALDIFDVEALKTASDTQLDQALVLTGYAKDLMLRAHFRDMYLAS